MIFKDSRYTNTRLAIDDGVTTFERRTIPHFNTTNCIVHVVVQDETLDLIAQKYYNNPKLWWAILDANIQTVQEFFNIVPGTRLYIPRLEDVKEVLTNNE